MVDLENVGQRLDQLEPIVEWLKTSLAELVAVFEKIKAELEALQLQ